MENKTAKAYLRYVRISPRKVQIVCDLIRGKDAGTALAILAQTPKAASEPLTKPRAQGRAYRINKRTSHVTLAVAEKN